MLQIRVMPCLLLQSGKLVKTVNFKNPNYIGDPVNAVKIYNDKEVDELVLLDIGATKENRGIDFEKVAEIASECFMPLAYGGGVHSLEEMEKIYNLGVEKIVICSEAAENPAFITQAATLFGRQSVVVAIDVKKNLWGKDEVMTHSGTRGTDLNPVDFAREMEQRGAGEIFLNSIDRDGTFSGYDTALIKKVSQAITIPLIACGGAGKVSDFAPAVKAGASAVAAGSLVVYHHNHRDGVLINFPSGNELKIALKGLR